MSLKQTSENTQCVPRQGETGLCEIYLLHSITTAEATVLLHRDFSTVGAHKGRQMPVELLPIVHRRH